MGEGFVVLQSNSVDIYFYMDEPGQYEVARLEQTWVQKFTILLNGLREKNRCLLCDRLCTIPEIFLESNSMQTTKVLWMRLQTEVPLVYTHAKKITYAC